MFLLDTWSLGRKHQIPKQYAQTQKHSKNFERKVLQLVLLDQLRRLSVASCHDVLQGNMGNDLMIARSLGVQRALVAVALVHKGIPYMVNDLC